MRKIATRLVLAVALLLPGAVMGASSAAAQDAAAPEAGSAVTVSGKGEFEKLEVTVIQTRNLINQTVRISWTGGEPTEDRIGTAGANFLQIMQCWGDDPNGPDRTQCQFGADPNGPPPAGFNVKSRKVDPRTPGELLQDTDGYQSLPFWPFDRERPTTLAQDDRSEFYDSQITNEVPVALTRADGTGQVDFEVQTLRQAAGLGCGTPVEGTTTVRPCWLVIVPRGTTNPDGSPSVPQPVSGSPLDLRVWENRIVVRLDFLPQRNACPFGVERPVTGHEVVADAVAKWQPALCANGGTLYGFTKQTDDLIRNQLTGTEPDLAITSDPVPVDQLQPDRPLVYAPVAVSGLTFAFNIMAQPPGVAGDPREALKGRPFTAMNLTPRLVAKLLTQSYRGALAGTGDAVGEGSQIVPARPARLPENPLSLQQDPEFLKFNPEYLADPERELFPSFLHIDTLVQGGTSDLTGLLWVWVLADPEARAFVDGSKDEWGMVVNDANKGLRPPLNNYPRRDQLCVPVTVQSSAGAFCPLDEHPFADDMNAAGRAASRGDTLGRINLPKRELDGRITFDRAGRQAVDRRAVMAVVDAATADRYRLPTAKLRNAAGEFVAPDAGGLGAGLAAMKPSGVDGVLQPDLADKNPAAYPLTAVSYAATVATALDEAAGREYAAFLRYAAGPGQEQGELPGQLPFGYLPLPEQLRAQTLAAATIIENRGVTPVAGDPPPGESSASRSPVGNSATGPGATGTGATGTGATGTGATGTGAGGTGTPSAAASGSGAARSGQQAAAAAEAPAGTPAQVVAAARRTPALPAPAVGALLVALLIGGGLAAALAPVTHLLGTQRRPAEGGDPTDRTATRSTPSWSTVRPALFARRR